MSEELIVPKNATIRQEYVRCGKYDCDKPHGPYYYAYWKDNAKLKKKYIGKDYGKGLLRLYNLPSCKHFAVTWTEVQKALFVKEQAEKGNELAKKYVVKLSAGEVSLEWGYKMVKEDIDGKRYFKMLRIAEKKGFKFESSEDLSNFIDSDMENKGFDITSKNALDSYLNSEIM